MYDAEDGRAITLSPARSQIGRFSNIPRPFLRWAGSKQALLHHIASVLPKSYGRYYEPFLGSGALFLFLSPTRATLSDASSELINTWSSIRDNTDFIINYLKPLKPEKELFYRIREDRALEKSERAAEFIYLNRSCWNGLYRVNASGKFNVPFGAPKSDFIMDEENIRACAKLLSQRNISIRNCDFSSTLRSARSGDLVFLDPPYVTKHNYNGFRDWNEKLFSWSDQERLATTAKRLADRGVNVIISNAEHDDILELYRDFSVLSISRSSTLASDSAKRGQVTEALFYNG